MGKTMKNKLYDCGNGCYSNPRDLCKIFNDEVIYLDNIKNFTKLPRKFNGLIFTINEKGNIEVYKPKKSLGGLFRKLELIKELSNDDYHKITKVIEELNNSVKSLSKNVENNNFYGVDDLQYLDFKNFQKDTSKFNIEEDYIYKSLNGGLEKEDEIYKRVRSPIATKCFISTINTENQDSLIIPAKTLNSNTLLVPFANVETFNSNYISLPNLFVPEDKIDRAYTSFRYIGNNIKSSLVAVSLKAKILITSDKVSYLRYGVVLPKINMNLYTENNNFPVRSKSFGVYGFNSFNSNSTNIGKINQRIGEFKNRNIFTDYSKAMDIVRNMEPIYFSETDGYDQGRISPDSNLEELNRKNLEYQRTTKWINCSIMTDYYVINMSEQDELNNPLYDYRRIQWKDAEGNIYYDNIESSVVGSNINKQGDDIICLPSKAVSFRIWYCGNKNVKNKIKIWELPKEINPFYGLWQDLEFNAVVSLDLFPDVIYSLGIFKYGGKNIDPFNEHSLIIENGSISMDIDAKANIMNKVKGDI